MSVLHKLASALNRRDEVPNEELAQEIAVKGDKSSVTELAENLKNKSKAIQNDCIKVLYEIGGRKPELIADHLNAFLTLLKSKNNRLQWGGMTAIGCIAKVKPQKVYDNLSLIMEAAEKGSVITRDNAVMILIQLATNPKYSKEAFDLLIEQLEESPPNQLPMYAERILPIVSKQKRNDFIDILQTRLPDLSQASKRKRVEKVIKKLSS